MKTVTVTSSRDRLVSAAMALFRRSGYSGTTVDAICAEAGMTKGAFFHSFPTKEAIALAALESYLGEVKRGYEGEYRNLPDPRRRLAGYVERTRQIAGSPLLEDGCLLGLLSRERTTPKITLRCAMGFELWAADLVKVLDQGAAGLAAARYLLAVLQGSLIVARAGQDPKILDHNLERCRRELDARLRVRVRRRPRG